MINVAARARWRAQQHRTGTRVAGVLWLAGGATSRDLFLSSLVATCIPRNHKPACPGVKPKPNWSSLRSSLPPPPQVRGKRLVVGHTPQLGGVNCECENQVWRIDVGMSYGVLNRPVQVIEIVPPEEGGDDAKVRVIRNTPNSMSSADDDITIASNL